MRSKFDLAADRLDTLIRRFDAICIRKDSEFSHIPHEEGYVYHATSKENLHDIANSPSLRTHKPWHGTDQDSWPDRSTEKRSYWSKTPTATEHFIPEGKPALIRAHKEHVKPKEERHTGDLYANKPIPTKHLQYHTGSSWAPVHSLR